MVVLTPAGYCHLAQDPYAEMALVWGRLWEPKDRGSELMC